MGEGIQWRRIMETAGIVRPKGQRQSPWAMAITGSLGFIVGIVGLLFDEPRTHWLYAALIVVGAAEAVWAATRIQRSRRNGAKGGLSA